MAALIQSFPQQSSTVTMLQSRPSSASGILQTSSQSQSHHQYPVNPQVQRNSIHGINGGGPSNYRAPIAPYAFTSTPSLSTSVGGQRLPNGPHLRPDQRTYSAPILPTDDDAAQPRSRYPAANSFSTTSSSSSDLSSQSHRSGSKDDSALYTTTARVAPRIPRPQSTIVMSPPGFLVAPANPSPIKNTPDRYRRPANRRSETLPNHSQAGLPNTMASPAASTMPNVMQFYGNSAQTAPKSPVSAGTDFQIPQFSKQHATSTAGTTVDDMALHRRAESEQAKRYRRRSIHSIGAAQDSANNGGRNSAVGLAQHGSRQSSSASGRIDQQPQPLGSHPLRSSPVESTRPGTSHGRNPSSDSVSSVRSAHNLGSASKRDASPVSAASGNPAPTSNTAVPSTSAPEQSTNNDSPRLVTIPPRASSTDAAKRIGNPSPLSKPMTMSPEPSASKDSFASAVNAALKPPQPQQQQQQPPPPPPTFAQVVSGGNTSSPAAKHLAALNDKEGKKSKTSRLRRAFSFGSAQELRRASAYSAESNASNNAPGAAVLDRTKMRQERYQDELEAEQAKIAQQQEAGGIGSGIYNGQGNFFNGSTDNLSISSTASSASVMIRKMGKGMKKSTRSLVGLFRPKSVIGVPAADAALPEVSQAQVSMVTVEAEREKLNVNASPSELAAGGTGFPKLDRNSLETSTLPTPLDMENSLTRKSIVGGERERAEVLAAVKKGILKRAVTDSPNGSPVIRASDSKSPNFNLPHIPSANDSPNSSTPSTPDGDPQGHRRTGSVTLGGEDYFMSALRFRGDSKSLPGTPAAIGKRNATFSPRIQFHDTWPSGEYDRRGEIATCNRLTPMLAQQIKEELNTFKMEMEVHENSKIYTHFF